VRGRVFKDKIVPHWFDGDAHFWYRNDLRDGTREFVLIDAEKGTRVPAFDHRKLAVALSAATKKDYKPDRLPFDSIEFLAGISAVQFQCDGYVWNCSLNEYDCLRVKDADNKRPAELLPLPQKDVAPTGGSNPLDFSETLPESEEAAYELEQQRRPRSGDSPDGKWSAILKENNVVLRARDSGKETQLTSNGVAGNAFDFVEWSPDSKTLIAYRTEPGDDKQVYLLESSPRDQLPARLRTRPYPRPGDKLAAHEMWLCDLETKKPIKVDIDRIDFGGIPRLTWLKDGLHFFFERIDRGHQHYRLIEVDVVNGQTRNVIEEKTETFVDHYQGNFFSYLERTDEIVFQSERDGWKHLYLIDARAGRVRNQITKGEWVVRGVEKVDEDRRQVWFRAGGLRAGQDPYLIHFCRINFDGSGLVDLTPGDGTHSVQYSPNRKYLIDTYSRVDLAPIHELRRAADGSLVCELDRADVSLLRETGWNYPEVFTTKGRDGKTDIWGIVCRPQKLDVTKQYPVVEYIYAGPHDSYVPKRFNPFIYEAQTLAELGFVVVQIDGMGTANRSRAFHDVCWKNVADAGFPDRILWIKALAERYPYVDTGRVGIYGGSAGGQNALGALLFHGDFYKVAYAACGCHDNRLDKLSWNEQWMGVMGPHYAEQSNVTNAHKLQGKLMLVVGEMDTNVPPESTMRVVDTLIKANKDFELIVLPGVNHTLGGPYGERRRRDFFVRNLHGVEPPDRNAAASRSAE
jgi:dipeptidyl aminopeptidase/acylaminoacyl peptidase